MIRRTILFPLACVLFSTVLSASAYAATIVVNTTSDENGENPNTCSLREAIKSSSLKQSFGGCTAGQVSFTDDIKLEAKTYTLTLGELVISGDMNIVGNPAQDEYLVDPLTGALPKRLPVATTIVATNGQRIFNTLTSASPLNLSNMNLKGGTADNGGSILAGGTVNLFRVHISGATATVQGGAIYLSGVQATVTATASSFTANNAPLGAVLGMSCIDNLGYAARTVTLNQISVIKNGSSNSQNIIDFCGQPTVTLSASTIAQNTTSNAPSSAVLRMVGEKNIRLSPDSQLNLVSTTLTENSSPAAFAYSYTSGLVLTNNFLAFNAGLDCQYLGLTNPAPKGNTVATFNLLTGKRNTGAINQCQLYRNMTAPDKETADDENNKYVASSRSRTDFLSPLGLYGGSDLQGYLPKLNTEIMHTGAVVSSCGNTDQRGLNRGSGVKIDLLKSAQNIACDIGALEYSILTVNDDQNGSNSSYDNFVHNTKVNTNGLTPEEIAKSTAQLDAYLKAYTDSFRYREVVMAVAGNDSAQESLNGDNSSTLGLLTDSTLYAITASSKDPNILCTWNADMKELLASRKDGTTTPGGSKDFCQYTVTNKLTGETPKENAEVSFTISNIAPIAKDDKYTLSFGTKSIPLDLLANDSDEGDGPFALSPNKKAGKPWWYILKTLIDPSKPATDGSNGSVNNIKSTPLNIRIVTQPTQGKIVPEFQGACPDNNINTTQATCYGGALTYVNNNLFSPFNDSFTYQVLDSDLTPSNTALVTVTNTATTTDVEKTGGGSLGLGALLGVLAMVFMRRRFIA